MRRALFALSAFLLATLAHDAGARAQTAADQTVLGPGLYVFQTRTVSASCGDDERTGYVSSWVAAIDGVPGSASMTMHVVDNQYWSTWTLTISADGVISGESFLTGSSGPSRPRNTFHVTRDSGGRFTGRSVRSYQRTEGGVAQQCEVTSDALLRRIDL